MMESNVSAILLAAGLSERMGGRDKLLLEYNGKTLLGRAVGLLDSFPFFEKILVTTKPRLERIVLPDAVQAVINPAPQTGQSGSIRLGLEAASGEWLLFLTADQPLLSAADLRPLFELMDGNGDKIVFPSLSGKPCSPTLFPARFRRDLLCITGDTGGREVRAAHPAACLTFEPEHPGHFLDIDSDEDYQRLEAAVPQGNRSVNDSI